MWAHTEFLKTRFCFFCFHARKIRNVCICTRCVSRLNMYFRLKASAHFECGRLFCKHVKIVRIRLRNYHSLIIFVRFALPIYLLFVVMYVICWHFIWAKIKTKKKTRRAFDVVWEIGSVLYLSCVSVCRFEEIISISSRGRAEILEIETSISEWFNIRPLR